MSEKERETNVSITEAITKFQFDILDQRPWWSSIQTINGFEKYITFAVLFQLLEDVTIIIIVKLLVQVQVLVFG